MVATWLSARAERRVSACERSLRARLAVGCAALAAACAALLARPLPGAAAYGAACVALVVAGAADARTGFLFDAVTLPAASLTALLAVLAGEGARSAAGMALAGLPFACVACATGGRALGFGDVKAMLAVGAAFGPLESFFVLFAACVSGILTASLRGRLRRGVEVRFGPHLAFGAMLTLVAGAPLAARLTGS
jgi:leader peptidase (prepilin peptidase)/N-methyltransferase